MVKLSRYLLSIVIFGPILAGIANTYAEPSGIGYPPAFDPNIPIEKLTVTCRACHGQEGKVPMFPGIPTIGFQDRTYLIMALKAFKYGERVINVKSSPLGTEMIKVAAMLSDENIERLADYFAVRPVWDMSQPVEYPASYIYPNEEE